MNSYVNCKMSNNTIWALPLEVIEMHRSSYYRSEFESLEESLEDTRELFSIDSNEIIEWLEGDMDWDDVKDHLFFVVDLEPNLTLEQMYKFSDKVVI